MSLIVDEHREYLRDAPRLEAFERAINAVVRPGDVVIDLGSGTGVLGILACRAGARRVYAIEAGGLIEMARAIALANGVADRIVYVNRHSSDVSLPEQGDVLVADFLGGLGFEAGIFGLYSDAARWLAPGARLIPSSIEMHVGPVDDAALFEETSFWQGAARGIDLRAALPWARNTGYPRMLQTSNLLSSATVHARFDPAAGARLLRLEGTVTAERSGTIHGIGGWFAAALAPGVELTNAPGAAARTRGKRNLFLPLDTPVAVAPGDVVSLGVRIRPEDPLAAWSLEVSGAAATVQERHSTFTGMLLSREDVRAGDPDRVPRLTPRGEARRTVLTLCDGRPLGAIEDEVLARHGTLFRTRADAQAFVAEILMRYTGFDA
jgi:protein arginine N-methyltransferase 1